MKTTFAQLIVASQGLAQLKAARMAPAAAVWVSRTHRLIAPEITTYEEQLMALAKELGTPQTDNPNAYRVEGPAFTEYTRRSDELALVELDLPLIPFKFDDLKIVDSVAPAAFDGLDFLLIYPEAH